MRTIIVRTANGLAKVEGDLFTGKYDRFQTPIFENDVLDVEVYSGFGSFVRTRAKMEWCDDCPGMHPVLVDEKFDDNPSVFEGQPLDIIRVVAQKQIQ